MRYVEVAGTSISMIGLGTWQFGSREWRYGASYADTEAVAITRRALELGVNLIDTAEIYGYGRSERIVGRAITGRRPSAFVATKLYPAMPVSPVVEQRAAASARRLGVSRIDLYQVHARNPAVPIGWTMAGMRALQQNGLVDHVGVSNFSLAHWQESEDALGGPVLSNQVRYSLAVRSAEKDVLPWAQENGRLVIAYSPLGQGLLAGRYGKTNVPADVRRRNPLFLDSSLDAAGEILRALRHVARAHAATPAQVALAWLIHRPNVVAIPGARTVAQLEENVAAAELHLTSDEDELLRQASARFPPQAGKRDVRRARLSTAVRRLPLRRSDHDAGNGTAAGRGRH